MLCHISIPDTNPIELHQGRRVGLDGCQSAVRNVLRSCLCFLQAPNSRANGIAAVAKADPQISPIATKIPRNIIALIGQDGYSITWFLQSATCLLQPHLFSFTLSPAKQHTFENAFATAFPQHLHRTHGPSSPAYDRLRPLRSPDPRRQRHSQHLHRTPQASVPPRNLRRPMLRQLQPALPPPQRHRLQRSHSADLRSHDEVRSPHSKTPLTQNPHHSLHTSHDSKC